MSERGRGEKVDVARGKGEGSEGKGEAGQKGEGEAKWWVGEGAIKKRIKMMSVARVGVKRGMEKVWHTY